MANYRFQVMAATVKETFTCPSCGKENRTRTFRGECTVNPFNVNADGYPKSPREVQRQSLERAERERTAFRNSPLCASCENSLDWRERKAISEARRAVVDLTSEA